MNKEQKKFKKVIKARKKRVIKKKKLEQERQKRKGVLSTLKAAFLKDKKERSEKITKERQQRAAQLRKVLDIAPSEDITLEALELLYIEIEKAVKASKNK